MHPMSRRLLLSVLLAFSLLFVQQGASLHSLSHILAEQTQDQSLPHDPQCDLCAAYAQIGNAVGSSQLYFDFSTSFGAVYDHSRDDPHTLTLAAFAARAPPHSA